MRSENVRKPLRTLFVPWPPALRSCLGWAQAGDWLRLLPAVQEVVQALEQCHCSHQHPPFQLSNSGFCCHCFYPLIYHGFGFSGFGFSGFGFSGCGFGFSGFGFGFGFGFSGFGFGFSGFGFGFSGFGFGFSGFGFSDVDGADFDNERKRRNMTRKSMRSDGYEICKSNYNS